MGRIKIHSTSKTKVSSSSKKVAVVRNNNSMVIIDNGAVRMRFTSVSSNELDKLKSPMYSVLVP